MKLRELYGTQWGIRKMHLMVAERNFVTCLPERVFFFGFSFLCTNASCDTAWESACIEEGSIVDGRAA